jgi:hypothetical protein
MLTMRSKRFASPPSQETFSFNLINENTVEIKIMDEDTLTKDDVIGECMVSLARAREQGRDSVQVPVVSSRSKKQRGFVSVSLKFHTNASLKPAQQHPAQPQQPQYYAHAAYAHAAHHPAPAPYGYAYPPAPAPYAPAPYPYGAPPAPYSYPSYGMPPAYPGAYATAPMAPPQRS